MIDYLLTTSWAADSPETIATSICCGVLVPVLTAIIAVIKKKVKPGSKEERIMSLTWKYAKEFFKAGKQVGESECKNKSKKPHGKPHSEVSGHPKKDGTKT